MTRLGHSLSQQIIYSVDGNGILPVADGGFCLANSYGGVVSTISPEMLAEIPRTQ